MDIGANIQKARRKSKLTQEQVIAQLQLMDFNVSRSTYAKIETNRINIRVSELVALKIILDAEFNDFFEGLENDKIISQ